MSSNDELIILKKKGRYQVHHNLWVDNNFKPNKGSLLKEFDNIKDAWKYAREFCNEWPYVEYGINIDNVMGEICRFLGEKNDHQKRS